MLNLEYAAAFFMLGGCPKDAINVCLRQLDDWQLGYALARAVEGGTDGPLVKWIIEETVIPLAMAGGHRWLATWAFWTIGKRDLAVRVLIVRFIFSRLWCLTPSLRWRISLNLGQASKFCQLGTRRTMIRACCCCFSISRASRFKPQREQTRYQKR